MQPSFPPDPAPLEVSSVEWRPHTPDAVEVHVRGRWLGPVMERVVPVLVVEDHVAVARPGTPAPATADDFVAVFEVPAELRSALTTGSALGVGGVEVALPGATPGNSAPVPPVPDEGEVIDRAVLAERRARRAELVEERLAQEAEDASNAATTLELQLTNLEQALSAATAERDRLVAELEVRDRDLRSARRREQAEQQMRTEAEAELEALRREGAGAAGLRRAEEAEARAGALEDEVARTRRALEEMRAIAAAREQARAAEAQRASALERQAVAAPAHDETIALAERTILEVTAARAEVERQVATIRGRLDALQARGDDARAQLAAERAAREGAERELGETRAALARAETELQRRAEAATRVFAALDEVRRELAAVRAQVDEGTSVDELVRQLAGTAGELRERVDRELAALVGELRTELAALRAAEAPAAAARDAALHEARRRIEALEGELAQARAEAEERARRQMVAEATIADLSVAAQRLRERAEAPPRPEEAAEAPTRRAGPAPAAMPPGDLPADPFDAAKALLRAAAEAAAMAPVEPEPEPEAEVEPEPEPEPTVEPEAEADPLPEPEHDDDVHASVPPPAPVPAPPARTPPAEESPLDPQVLPPDQRVGHPWLHYGIAALGALDPDSAVQLFLELLPDQARTIEKPLTYDLTVRGAGAHRVKLAPGQAEIVARDQAGGAPAEFAITGTPAELAALVAGRAPRRLRGLKVEGSRRRVRPLVKARQAPVSLGQIAESALRPDPELILRLLAAAVDPQWTIGHGFCVAHHVLGRGTWKVCVNEGGPLSVAPGDLHAAATVHAAEGALLALLTRTPPPPGERATVSGNPVAVTLLHGWFDRVQGLSARG